VPASAITVTTCRARSLASSSARFYEVTGLGPQKTHSWPTALLTRACCCSSIIATSLNENDDGSQTFLPEMQRRGGER
jgi:hypothetical protein